MPVPACDLPSKTHSMAVFPRPTRPSYSRPSTRSCSNISTRITKAKVKAPTAETPDLGASLVEPGSNNCGRAVKGRRAREPEDGNQKSEVRGRRPVGIEVRLVLESLNRRAG